jgi:2-amino-4-hydroxy-6-hydroxymethyldihydropteridine diphosphokinase
MRISEHHQCFQGGIIIIALGSNLTGTFGKPGQTLSRALEELTSSGVTIINTSWLYWTKAHARAPQPDFLNAIATVSTPLSAFALLRVLKRIEAKAGRRTTKRARPTELSWEPRALDLDIVCYKGIVCNWKARRPAEGERVILPHPRAHERAFVLKPLVDVAPSWRHPVFGLTAVELLKKPLVRLTGEILRAAGHL